MKILQYKTKKEQEVQVLFDGAFIENKPIGFPNGFTSDAYSNIFYWAHLEAYETSEFPLHPHEGFEIITFVLEGEVLHYDTALKEYKSLKKGDVQVIKSNSGISHSEKITKGTRLFQIWFDPDFSKSLKVNASYRDYKSEEFISVNENNIKTKYYIRDKKMIDSSVEGLKISTQYLKKGDYNYNIDDNYIYSFYILYGQIEINDKLVNKDDFLVLEDTKTLGYKVKNEAEVFMIKTLKNINYNRFINRYKRG